jgi:hypothetical protein
MSQTPPPTSDIIPARLLYSGLGWTTPRGALLRRPTKDVKGGLSPFILHTSLTPEHMLTDEALDEKILAIVKPLHITTRG